MDAGYYDIAIDFILFIKLFIFYGYFRRAINYKQAKHQQSQRG